MIEQPKYGDDLFAVDMKLNHIVESGAEIPKRLLCRIPSGRQTKIKTAFGNTLARRFLGGYIFALFKLPVYSFFKLLIGFILAAPYIFTPVVTIVIITAITVVINIVLIFISILNANLSSQPDIK